MLAQQLNAAFEMIYRSFNQYGHQIASDEERHPEYTTQLLRALGRPDQALRNVMVTGSKGKGSTALLIARLLRARGSSTGLFTSPHLLDSLERIRVNGLMISETEFVKVFSHIEPVLRRLLEDQLPVGQYLGPVGIFAVMAAWFYRASGAEWAVYETGRGALYDDVACISHPYAVITTVLPEHVRELGPTLAKIAWHKAGVISPDTRVVVLGSRESVLQQAVDARCRQLGIKPQLLWADQRVKIDARRINDHGTQFDMRFHDGRFWQDMTMRQLGPIADNLALAVAVVEEVAGPLSESQVREAASSARWPGRGEVLSQSPFLLLDAGVRPESLNPWLKALPVFDRVLLSVPDGKDRGGMVNLAQQHGKEIILTACSNPRLRYQFDRAARQTKVTVISDVRRALDMTLSDLPPDARVFLCGTISFVADVYRYLGRSVL